MDIEERRQEREGPIKQFQTENHYQRKLVESHQDNEYTRINKHHEGQCYGCFKNRYVRATLFDICAKCMSKRGHETVMAIAGKKWGMYCYFCGTMQNKIIVLNARICDSCEHTVARNSKYLRKHGIESVHPFYKKLKHDFGKDYKILMQQGGNVRA